MVESNALLQPYCCITCTAKFIAGEIRIIASLWICPVCESNNIHPINMSVIELDEYFGVIGTKH